MPGRSKNRIKDSKNALQGSQVNTEGDFRVGDNFNDNSTQTYYQLIFGAGRVSISLISLTLSVTLVLGIYFFKNEWLPPFGEKPEQELVGQPGAGTETEQEPSGAESDPAQPENEVNKLPPSAPAPAPRKKEETKPKDNRADLIDAQQQIAVAFFQPAALQLHEVREHLLHEIRLEKLKISSTFFRPAFMARFSGPLASLDFAYLRSLPLPASLNCICQISEEVVLEEDSHDGAAFWSAKGKLRIQVYDLRNDDLFTIPFKMVSGAGISQSAALSSLEERLLQSEDWNKLDFSPCK